ncbi:hypothetical protein BRD17_08020 [Halobacteriales archaeon SW_7_68_16]|nr:MAG: hypothetical protein BRD17_08020 [Halobacteriales archaeon SW_7_68_16]
MARRRRRQSGGGGAAAAALFALLALGLGIGGTTYVLVVDNPLGGGPVLGDDGGNGGADTSAPTDQYEFRLRFPSADNLTVRSTLGTTYPLPSDGRRLLAVTDADSIRIRGQDGEPRREIDPDPGFGADVIVGPDREHATIAAGIAAADAGDEVVVTRGTYRETVRVNKTVALVAEQGTTIAPPAGASPTAAVSIAAERASLVGFRVDADPDGPGSARYGVRVTEDRARIVGTLIEDARRDGSSGAAILIAGDAHDTTVEHTHVLDSTTGIRVDTSSGTQTITRNLVPAAGPVGNDRTIVNTVDNDRLDASGNYFGTTDGNYAVVGIVRTTNVLDRQPDRLRTVD